MGLFSKRNIVKAVTQSNSNVEFSKAELSLIMSIPVMPGDKFNENMKSSNIYEQGSMYIQGTAGYFVSHKEYALAEKLALLAEERAANVIDLHYCYNMWIDLLYKQRENVEKLNSCIDYCKKDIDLYPDFDKANRSKYGNTPLHIPAFERLAIIYEKCGDYENATKINALALSYPYISKHESYQKRLDKIKAKK